jgi:hypothetical protein
MNEVTTEKRKSSAELKAEIHAAQVAERESKKKTELMQSGLPLTAIADQINANSTTQAPKTESKSQPAQAPAEPATEKATVQKTESVELQEWKKKKGINWDTPDSVALELRKLDQEFHRKRAEEVKNGTDQRPPQANGWTPQPNFAPQPPVNPYPNYVQPAPVPSRQLVEKLAHQYGVLPDEFEKITAIQRDLTAAMLQQQRQLDQQKWEQMERENIKNSEFRELSADPVFRRPEVAKAFHEVIENMQVTDPSSFSQDPYVYRKAFDRALTNIARRNLEGAVPYQETPSPFQLPNTPPRPLGQGAGGGRDANENGLTQAEFERLPVDEKRKILSQMGLVQPKY